MEKEEEEKEEEEEEEEEGGGGGDGYHIGYCCRFSQQSLAPTERIKASATNRWYSMHTHKQATWF